MKRIWKRISALALAAALLCGASPAAGIGGALTLRASAVTLSGECGESVSWSLDTDAGVLTVSGTGAMKNYSSSSAVPWYSERLSVRTVVIGDGVTSIGYRAFLDCTSLTSVTIGNGVTSIRDNAFRYCTSLASVTIPDSVTSIGKYAFYNCASLASVTIGNSVASIGRAAFSGCDSLTSVTIPDNVKNIDDSAFSDCDSLTSVTIGNSVTSIGYDAFNSCTNLASVTIPDSVTYIGDSAFYGCTGLTSITIPDSVTRIRDSAFGKCTSLTAIIVDEKNPAYFSDVSGVLFDKTRTTLIQYPAGNPQTAYTIPDSVTSIGDYAFEDSTSLASVTIPDSVTSIGYRAFWWCTSLASVTIPDSVTSIGHGAFLYCTSLASVTIGNGVTSIGDDTFATCMSLASVTIPDSVTSIGDSAFERCTSLESVTIPDGVTRIGDDAFYRCTSLSDVYYTGSETQWKQISIGSSNDCLTNAAIHYNYTHPDEPGTEFTVIYTINGTYYSEQKVVSGGTITPPDYTVPEGYTFSGWAYSGAVRSDMTLDAVLTKQTQPEGKDQLEMTPTVIDPENGPDLNDNCGNHILEINKAYQIEITLYSFSDSWEDRIRFSFEGPQNGAITGEFKLIQKGETAEGGYFYEIIFSFIVKEAGDYTITFETPYSGTEPQAVSIKAARVLYSAEVTNPAFVRYSFKNDNYNIDEKIVRAMYGAAKTSVLPKKFLNGAVCYGMAVSTAIFAHHPEMLLLFDGATKQTDLVRDPEPTYSIPLCMDVLEWIKAVQIAQKAKDIESQKVTNLRDIYTLVNTRDTPIPIGMEHKKEPHDSHRLLAIGQVDGLNNDCHNIAIYDPNSPEITYILEISKDFKTWRLNASFKYSSELGDSIYAARPEEMDKIYSCRFNFDPALSGTSDHEISKGNLLIRTNIVLWDQAKMRQVDFSSRNTAGNEEPAEPEYYYYWVDDNVHTVSLSAPEAASVQVMDINSGISAEIPANETADITVDDADRNAFRTTCRNGDLICASFLHFSENGEEEIQIEGTSSGGEVLMEECDNGIDVTGLSSGTVTLKNNDSETVSQVIDTNDGKIRITYDAEQITVIPKPDQSKEYTIRWIVDAAVTEGRLEEGTAIIKPANPFKEGYTFIGWSPAVPATMPAQNMTFTAVFEKIPDPVIKIHNYTSSRTVDYRTTITFTAEVANAVPGAAVHWFVNGQDKGASDTYTEKEAKANFTVQAKYVKDGAVLAESEVETVKVNTGFFARLVAFFRGLFGRLPKVVQAYLGFERIDRVLS